MPRHSPPRYETRPGKQEDESFLYSCYQRTMRGYIDQTWGWDEEFQRMSFIEHLSWQRFRVITTGMHRVIAILDRSRNDVY
jgi:hypothetical protein